MAPTNQAILVVDDDEDIREMVQHVLESSGFRVRTAADGVHALEQLDADGAVALVLLDLMMPRMDGAQFIQVLRKGRHTKVPVLVMSGHHAGPETAERLGADECLVKPVELDDLLDSVRRHCPRC